MTDQVILDDGPITVTEGVDAQGRRTAHITFGVKPNHYPKPGPIGNTTGVILPQTQPALGDDEAPEAEPETEEESAWDAFMSGLKEGAQYYKDNVSEALHDFAGNAMETGSNVAVAGMATTASGGAMALTVVGAAPGAALATVGGATTVTGGAVTGIGALAETAATALDSAADAILSGSAPEVLDPLISWASTLLQRTILNKVPGMGGSPSPRSGGRDGFVVNGNGKGNPRCKLRAYSKGCENGQTPHHVVPDHVFRDTEGNRYDGEPSHGQGLAVCVDGKTKSSGVDGKPIKRSAFDSVREYFKQLATHGRIHARVDAREFILGLKGTPKGTTTLGEMEAAGARAVAKETGCNAADLQKQLRDYHGDKPFSLPPESRVRADPTGRVFENPPKEIMGRPNQGGLSRD